MVDGQVASLAEVEEGAPVRATYDPSHRALRIEIGEGTAAGSTR